METRMKMILKKYCSPKYSPKNCSQCQYQWIWNNKGKRVRILYNEKESKKVANKAQHEVKKIKETKKKMMNNLKAAKVGKC